MAGLSRVPAPRSPFDGWWAAIGGSLLVVIAALAIEPWGSTRTPSGPTPSPYQARTSAIPAVPIADGPAAELRTYRPEAFGAEPRPTDWTIRTPDRVVPVPSIGMAAAPDIASGPVVDLGPASQLDVIVIGGPAGSALDTIRLWRFDARGRPERQDLARLAAPWPNVPAWAVGLRVPRAAEGVVAAWQPGLYRLDLLVEPAGTIRMVMLSVRADGDRDSRGVARRPGDTDRAAFDAFGASILRRLPQAANLWTVGEILTGWARPPAAGDCRVAQIWRARGPEAGCWPVPIGPTSALGVNLPAGQRVATIELAQVDPLPGPVALRSRIAVSGRPGVAALETPAGGLADGIYRMTVGVVGGHDEHWYVEVGPDGRRAAEINAFVTNAQR
jgi:hypothetical protein